MGKVVQGRGKAEIGGVGRRGTMLVFHNELVNNLHFFMHFRRIEKIGSISTC